MSHPYFDHLARLNRRQFFGSSAAGVGLAALSSLLGADGDGSRCEPGLPGLPHHPPKARRVVVLWQGGGPSHVDLFDEKPILRRMAGQDIPDSVRGSTRLSTMSSGYGKWPCVPAIKPFRRYGRSGIALERNATRTSARWRTTSAWCAA